MKDLESHEQLRHKVELQRELLKRGAQNGCFLSFAKYIKTDYEAKQHHKLIISKLEWFVNSESKYLAIFMPPQHGKSEIATRLFPSYVLGVKPDHKIVISSYSSDLADSFNRDVQRIIDSDYYADIFSETKLNSKNVVTTQNWLRNSEIFEVVGKKGSLKSVGVGGGLTGRPVDLAIIDDPVKDDIEAKSPTFRERVWNWYISVLSTRLHNDSKVILIMTRWHEDDLAGRLLNPKINPNAHMWEVLSIPAIYNGHSIEGDTRGIGDALWPEKHNIEKLNVLKGMDPVAFESLYQQNPIQQGGNKVKTEWFKMVDSAPNFGFVDIWIDGAYTDKTKNDPSALMATTFDSQSKTLYVLSAHTGRYELPEMINVSQQFISRFNGRIIIRIEPKASGLSLKQMLNKVSSTPAIEISSKLVAEGKEARIQTAAPYIQSGKIMFVIGDYFSELQLQITGFPKVKHDEYVDLLGYAADHYFMKTAEILQNAYYETNLM